MRGGVPFARPTARSPDINPLANPELAVAGPGEGPALQYMVIEDFRDARAIYERLAERGRMLPDGLRYVDSWISADLGRCFQLMEADRRELFDAWIASWSDLMRCEVVPVLPSSEAAERALGGQA